MGAMELEEKTVQIRDDFDPDKILESGQCFRPGSRRRAGIGLFPGDSCFTSDHCAAEPTRCGVSRAHGKPSGTVTSTLAAAMPPCAELDSRDDFLQRAMEYGRGIRVLRRDEWEMLVGFIISQRKSIPAIRRAVELLSERFGERLGSDSEGPVYAFPTAEALCCAGEQALQECGLGYRTRYVLHAAHRRQRAHWT